jgi:hypothetical protein
MLCTQARSHLEARRVHANLRISENTVLVEIEPNDVDRRVVDTCGGGSRPGRLRRTWKKDDSAKSATSGAGAGSRKPAASITVAML